MVTASPGIKVALLCNCCGDEFVSLVGPPQHVLRVWDLSRKPFATCKRGGALLERWWRWDGASLGTEMTPEEIQQLKVSVVLDAI